MTPNFAPPPQTHGHIPVLIAAVQERMLQVAGEVCDGVRLHGIVTRKYLDQIARTGFDRVIGTSGTILSIGAVVTAADGLPLETPLRNRRIAAKQER